MIKPSNKKKSILIALIVASSVISILFFFIFSSQGKKLSPDGEVIQTSVIRINSSPKDVTAYLDGTEVEISDNLIQEVPIGVSDLTITKEGYSTWEKTIQVEKGKVKDVFVQLFPLELENEQLSSLPISKIFYTDELDDIFYFVTDSEIVDENGLWKLEISNGLLNLNNSNEPSKISFKPSSVFNILQDNEFDAEISEDGDKMLVNIIDQNLLYVVDLSSGEAINVVSILGFKPTNLNWFGSASNEILVTKENSIFVSDLNYEKRDLILHSNTEHSLCTTGSKIYYIDQDLKKVFEYQEGNHLILDLFEDESITLNENSKIYCGEDSDNLIFVLESGLFFYNNTTNKLSKLDTSASILSVASNGSSFLYENQGEVYAVSIEDKDRDQNLKRNVTDIKIDESILEIKYTNNGEKLLILDKTGIVVRDKDGSNPIRILNEIDYLSHSVEFSNDNERLYIVLKSSTETTEGESTKNSYNLYIFDLTE